MSEEAETVARVDVIDHRENEALPYFAAEVGERDAKILALRARKFRALAALFRLELDDYPSAIRSLLETCPDIWDCPVVLGTASASGQAALDWAAAAQDDSTVHAEHVRLFGGPDRVRQMPIVSPCAAAYMSEDYDGDPAVVSAIYGATGFEPRLDGGKCPAHVSNELDFLAYCYERGDRDSLTVAHVFIVTHLFAWGVLFAAAVYARAQHPVTRFGGMMLEQMLFCEMEHARNRSLFYRFLAHSAVAS